MRRPGRPLIAGAETFARHSLRDSAILRGQQVTAHEYLAAGGREALTADSERLVERLPASGGSTLEIGFGYGLTAKRGAARSARDVGIEVQTAQRRPFRCARGFRLGAAIPTPPL